jgi:UDP-galactopyranose mutase
MERPVVVIGAGPAGIGAGIALGEHATVVDGCPELGGLARTIELDGAVFDMGGHSFHTPHADVRALVYGSIEMVEQPRDARCFSLGQMIPYPFQAYFRELRDPDVVRECAAGLTAARGPRDGGNLEEFLSDRYGTGIARHFLLPYNRKLWQVDLTRLAADWVSERIAAPEHARESFAESGGRRRPLQGDTIVAYPARGGFGEIWRALARRLDDLRLGKTVVRVDPARSEVVLAGGEALRWQRVVSTMPLPELLTLLPDVPRALARDADRLEYLSLALVLVVVGHPVNTPIQRVYCAGPESPAHKTAINHTSSPYLRSLPHHGILAEVSCPVGQQWPAGDLERQVVEGLVRMRLIESAAEVRSTQIVRVRYAYPLPTPERAAIVDCGFRPS